MLKVTGNMRGVTEFLSYSTCSEAVCRVSKDIPASPILKDPQQRPLQKIGQFKKTRGHHTCNA